MRVNDSGMYTTLHIHRYGAYDFHLHFHAEHFNKNQHDDFLSKLRWFSLYEKADLMECDDKKTNVYCVLMHLMPCATFNEREKSREQVANIHSIRNANKSSLCS